MKYISIMLSAAALSGLLSCTSSDVVDDTWRSESNRIGFDTNVSKNSRAVNNSNFQRFFVYGTYTVPTQTQPFSVFTGDIVTKNASGVWTYSGDRYWVPEGSYDFYAYSCENEAVSENVSGTATLNQRVCNINGFRSNASHQHDLLFAKVLNQSRPAHTDGVTPAPVAFRFAHVLSRVVFTFRSSFPAGYTVKVSNPRLVNFRDQGDFRGETLEWINVDRSQSDITMTLSLGSSSVNVTSAAASTAPVYLIPFSYAQANVSLMFDVNVEKDGEAVLGRTIKATWCPDWKAGHSINNEITVTGGRTGLDPIRFTGEIGGGTGSDADGWNEDTGKLNGLVFE